MRKLGFAILLIGIQTSYCQDSENALQKGTELPENYVSIIERKSSEAEQKLITQTEKYLSSLSNQEEKLRKKLARIDSNKARALFDNIKGRYQLLQERIENPGQFVRRYGNSYVPLLDSLGTSLNFLKDGNIPLINGLKGSEKITESLAKLNSLQGKLDQAELIREFIKERRELLMEQLSQFGLLKDLKKFNQQFYYFETQLNEFKESLNDPEKLIAKSLGLLQKIPAFREFFNKHSELASLFLLPGNNGTIDPSNFTGLQTRASVQNLLQQRFGGPGIITSNLLGQQVNSAQTQLGQLRDRINNIGGSSSEVNMPDFKPNNQRTKSFWNRLEFGTNFQTVRSNGFFPTTTDFGLSLGYKLNDKSIIGVGVSYKMGWGENINKIKITHQGVGLRSFVDVKLKGSIYISGGGELNYRNQIRQFDQLNEITAWQKSALIGLTKNYRISSKLKGNLQLLYDFLYKKQVPRGQAVLFRLGYKF